MSQKDRAGDLPWWLESGVEECEVCFAAVHYEALYHCVDCDRPLCPVCAVTVIETRSVVCSECGEAGGR